MKRLLLLTIFVMSGIWSSNAYADGYGGFWEIDDPIVFVFHVHDATGIAQACDSEVYWRCYEMETGTSLLNGTMTRLDSSNFPGMYSEQITLTAASGFEVSKTYIFAAKAGVDGVTAETSALFQIIDPDTFKAVITSLATAANLQTVDDNVDAVKAKTDQFVFTTANKVDARVDYVGSNAVTGPNDFKATGFSTFDYTSNQVTVATNNDKTGYALTGSYLTETETNGLIERATGDIITEIGTLSIPTVNQIVAGIWAETLPGSFNAGEAGYILGTNLDATVSSRSSHSAANVWSSGTRTLTDPDSYKADVSLLALEANVETHVSNSLGTYDGPTKSEMDAGFLAAEATPEAILVDTAKLLSTSPEIELDGSVYRFTTNALEQGPSGGGGGDATAANQTTIIAALTAQEATQEAILTDTAAIPTAAAIADAVHDEAMSGHTTAGTFGQYMKWVYIWAIGRFDKSSNTYTYKDSGDNTVFSFDISSSSRTHAE